MSERELQNFWGSREILLHREKSESLGQGCLEARWGKALGQELVLGAGFPPKSMLGPLGAEFCRLGRLGDLPDFGLFCSSLRLSVSLRDSSGYVRTLVFMDARLGFDLAFKQGAWQAVSEAVTVRGEKNCYPGDTNWGGSHPC